MIATDVLQKYASAAAVATSLIGIVAVDRLSVLRCRIDRPAGGAADIFARRRRAAAQ